MTQKPHDQFAKQYLEGLLAPLGKVKIGQEVSPEVRQVDVYFSPLPTPSPSPPNLGLLGQMVETPCSLEPFRNSPSKTDIRNCMLKLYSLHSQLQRKAKRKNQTLTETELPQLWILTPSASDRLLNSFGFTRKDKWEQGVYVLPEAQKTALIAINRLSETPETLWLRILGKGKLQERAILELIALERENPLRIHALEQVAIWRVNLQMQAHPTTEQQELMMALSPAYLQWREEAVQQGQRMMLESMLTVRFGFVDEELAATIDRLLKLPSQEAVSLVLQCTREELLERFNDR
ncbi:MULTISPECIES: hypothetical protein [Spirulina sp. CCY15215]|uniref:hypothetical protein n=1 Tax=Spirulina sp. CCY15215 TaxID=2767591 RepID=UPI00194E45B0|nr:hypothetical protein [Spirulina major]